jgi:hypothetical protein
MIKGIRFYKDGKENPQLLIAVQMDDKEALERASEIILQIAGVRPVNTGLSDPEPIVSGDEPVPNLEEVEEIIPSFLKDEAKKTFTQGVFKGKTPAEVLKDADELTLLKILVIYTNKDMPDELLKDTSMN